MRRLCEAQIRAAHRVLERLQPDVLLSWGDRHLGLEPPVLVAARQRHVKVLLPYISYSSSRVVLWSRRQFGEPRRWRPFSLYRLVANVRLPDTIREGFFFLEPHVLMALKKIGALSRNPWTLGAGLSDAVCVDSDVTRAQYQSEGVPAEKLHVLGSPEFDALHRGAAARATLRDDLAQRYGIALDCRLIVLALPQFAEQGVLGWDDHWREVRHIVGEVARTGCAVLVSLHPRVNAAHYEFLEKEFGVRVVVEPLKAILPAADAFVAVNSSTVLWAVLCGVRAFVLDFYGLESSQFDRLKSVTFLRNRASLRADLSRGVRAPVDFTDDWTLLSRARVFDGRVIERYRALIWSLAT